MARRKRRAAATPEVAPRPVAAANSDGVTSSAVPAKGNPASRWFRWPDVWFGFALAAVLFLVYQPVWHGGLLWDDDAHVTRPEYNSVGGLRRIWCELKTTPQYYPMVYSTFWLEHHLWGDDTLGCHWVNIGLHALAAFLVLKILRRLEIPGAYLAAAIFALHPVQVESVAWMTELKNTLSGVFYLVSVVEGRSLRVGGSRAASTLARSQS